MTVPLEEFPGVQFDVFITFNGSYCYDKDRVLFASPIPTEDIRTLRRNAAALGRPMCLATESRLAANGTDADLADYCAIAKIPVPIAEDFDALAAGKVYQIMIGGRAEEYGRLMQDVHGAKIAAWWDRAMDIIPTAGRQGHRHRPCTGGLRHRQSRRHGLWRRQQRSGNVWRRGYRRGHGQRLGRIESRSHRHLRCLRGGRHPSLLCRAWAD